MNEEKLNRFELKCNGKLVMGTGLQNEHPESEEEIKAVLEILLGAFEGEKVPVRKTLF